MKTALVLSGGGFRGAFQYGALKYLNEMGVKYDLISGISVGALNGAMVATGNFEKLSNFWDSVYLNGSDEIYNPKILSLKSGLKLDWKKLYRYFFKDQSIFSLLTKGGRTRLLLKWNNLQSLTSSEPLKEKLKEINLSDFQVPFLTGAVSLTTGDLHFHSNKDFISSDEFRLFIEASATMPIICEPIESVYTRSSKLSKLVDGGIRVILPLSQTLEYIKKTNEDWRIIVINCSSGILPPLTGNINLGKIALRSLNDIALNQIFRENLKSAEIVNKFVKQSKKKSLLGYRNYPLITVSPEGYSIGDTLDSSKEIIFKRIQLGYSVCAKAIEKEW